MVTLFLSTPLYIPYMNTEMGKLQALFVFLVGSLRIALSLCSVLLLLTFSGSQIIILHPEGSTIKQYL